MDYFFIRFKLVIKKFIFIHGDLMNVLGDILVGTRFKIFFQLFVWSDFSHKKTSYSEALISHPV